ncbi:unnamed protein product [Protopolystoma xenopodis]|uniref:Uncharacterized protein n=1 Tax=Protopolystoma xenopodis TaxID=117903 RepID=A0A448WZ77_9PLAT|nr:unnamed protein product [Protopolystoma xenopodis]
MCRGLGTEEECGAIGDGEAGDEWRTCRRVPCAGGHLQSLGYRLMDGEPVNTHGWHRLSPLESIEPACRCPLH